MDIEAILMHNASAPKEQGMFSMGILMHKSSLRGCVESQRLHVICPIQRLTIVRLWPT